MTEFLPWWGLGTKLSAFAVKKVGSCIQHESLGLLLKDQKMIGDLIVSEEKYAKNDSRVLKGKCNYCHQLFTTDGPLDVVAHSQGIWKGLEFHCLSGFE